MIKSPSSETNVRYTYHFDEHDLSPGNQLLTRLFRQMIRAVEEQLEHVEVEYIDAKLAKEMGVVRAQETLRLLGATPERIRENRYGDYVLSRIFRAPLTPEALQFFKTIKDLQQLSAYRLLAGERVKAEVFFVQTMSVDLDADQERCFIRLLREERIPYKVI